MTIAADTRYRSVALSFQNYDALGNEMVQVFAKPAGGVWSLAFWFSVAGIDQAVTWETALPLTLYNLAMRYVAGTTAVPGVGYEGDNPDAWTASSAAGAKTTVTTTCADVSGLAGVFASAAAPLLLTWDCVQQGVPFLIEKDIGAGFVQVASGIVGNAYLYTIPAGELGTTVSFRVTAKQSTIAGPSDTTSVLMALVVGANAISSTSFDPMTGIATINWSVAANATGYQLEKSTDGGAAWSVVASPDALTYAYTIAPAEANTTVKFRVRGVNGTVVGAYSGTADVAMTIALTAPVLAAPSWTLGRYHLRYYGHVGLAWTGSAAADYYRVERNVNGAGWVTVWQTSNLTYNDCTDSNINPPYAMPDSLHANKSVSYRVSAHNPLIGFGAASNIQAIPLTYAEDETLASVVQSAGQQFTFTFGPDATGTVLYASGGGDVAQGLILEALAVTSGVPLTIHGVGVGARYLFAIAKNGTTDYGNPSVPISQIVTT